MTARIGTHNVRIDEAPSGYLIVLINGKPLRDRSFIFAKDAISAAKKEISTQTK
jgi:hypothetical protein